MKDMTSEIPTTKFYVNSSLSIRPRDRCCVESPPCTWSSSGGHLVNRYCDRSMSPHQDVSAEEWNKIIPKAFKVTRWSINKQNGFVRLSSQQTSMFTLAV